MNSMRKMSIASSFTELCFVNPSTLKGDRVSPLPESDLTRDLVWAGDVIQDSYRSDKIDMCFDMQVLADLIEGVCRFYVALQSDVKVRYCDGRIGGTGFSQWLTIASAQPEVDREPPSEIYLPRDEKVIFCALTEPWVLAGGPLPYHDSYTYVLFTFPNWAEALLDYLRSALRTEGRRIID